MKKWNTDIKSTMALKALGVGMFVQLFCHSGFCFGGPAEMVIRVKVNGIDLCADLEPKIMTFLLGMNSFRQNNLERQERHIFDVQCSIEGIAAEWRLVGPKSEEYVVASTQITEKDSRGVKSDTLAFMLVKQTMQKLQWDGEISVVLPAKRSKIKFIDRPGNQKANYYFGETSTGFASNTELGECVPLEILRFNYAKESIQPAGHGLILKAGNVTGKAELITNSAKSQTRRLFFRIIFGSSVPEWLKQSVEKCKIAAGEARESGVRYDDSDFELTRDNIIELRRVSQTAGLVYGRLAANNGVKVKTMLGGMVNNHLEIGRWGSVDMRALRSLYTTGYLSDNELLKTSSPELTLGEFYTMLRLSYAKWTLEGGPGLLMDKLNLYYEDENNQVEGAEVAIGIRRTSFRAAGQVSLRYDWTGSSLRYRYSRSWSKISPFLTNDIAYNLELTDTWSVGGGAYHLVLGDTIFGEPGARFMGVYGSIGITLKNKK